MRPIWSGSISFGLVTVPVRMFSATESKELRFHFLHKDDLQPIGYDKVRKDTGEHVDPDDVVRGFEIEKGKYVPIEDEDLDRLDIELTHSIDILDFVDLEEIDPIYFRKAYYLEPQNGAETPYRLLARALDETKKVAIAKVVIRNKQHLAAMRSWDGVLVLETMYYADEVRDFDAIDLEDSGAVRDKEVALAEMLINELTEKKFDPLQFKDEYRHRLLDRIRAKSKGKAIEPEEKEEEKGGEVIDIMEALRRSLGKGAPARPRRATARKTPAKRRTTATHKKRKAS